MFDIVDLPKTPRIARRLVEMSRIGGLSVTDDIIELASYGLITQQEFDDVDVALTEKEKAALQFITDRNGRAVVLEDPSNKANTTSIAYVRLTKKLPALIVTNLPTFIRWVLLIRDVYPEASINVFDTRKHKISDLASTADNINLIVSNEPVDGCDFYIAVPSEIYRTDAMEKIKFKQVIINHISDVGSITNAVLNTIKFLCIEVKSTLIFVNIRQCVAQARSSDDIRISDVKWNENNLAIKTSIEYLYPNIHLAPFISSNFGHLTKHLDSNNIDVDRSKWLPILNISYDLLD